MEALGGFLNPDKGFVRRSSRKRRSPGEWWKDFSTETRNTRARISEEEQAQNAFSLNEKRPSTVQRSQDNSNAREKLQHCPSTIDECGEVHVGCLAHEEKLYQDISLHGVTNRTTKALPLVCISTAGGSTANEIQTLAYRMKSNDNPEQPDQKLETGLLTSQSLVDRPTSDDHEESAPCWTNDNCASVSPPECQRQTSPSLPTVIASHRGSNNANFTGFLSHVAKEVGISDDSPRKTDSGRCHPLSGKESSGETGTYQKLISEDQETPSKAHIDQDQAGGDNKNKREENKGQATRLEYVGKDARQTCRKARGADKSLESYRSKKRFSGAQVHDTLEASTLPRQEGTPLPFRKLSATDFVDNFKPQSKELPKVKAPWESRNKLVSPNRSKKRFSGAQVHGTLDASTLPRQEGTPLPSRKLSATGFVDDSKPQSIELSKVKAPRKSRNKPVSPRFSFSLRSSPAPQSFPASMFRAAENEHALIDANMEDPSYAQQKVLVAKRTALQYHLVTGHRGIVKVAISISLNKSTIGEVVILPRSATGPRRALTGDEFYIVKQGYVECDIDFTSLTLSVGDHLGIPEGQCFEIRNPSSSSSELFFFSPKNIKNYSLSH